MDSRKIFLLIGAAFVAVFAAFGSLSYFRGSGVPAAGAAGVVTQVDGPQVLVATRELPVGTILDATALKFQPWPKELVQDAYYLKDNTDLQSLQGTVVRNPVTAGQPVTQGSLVKPGDRGFLAAALGPGMRAVTVPVSTQNAVAGFVFPGDRVDLVLTQSVAGGGDGQPLKVSETVIRNLRILATDQRTDNLVDENGKTVVRAFSNVTIEATPKIAEDIAVAQTLGSLSLSLRPLADNDDELKQAIARGDIKAPAGTNPANPSGTGADKAMMIQLASQPIVGNSTFATGADVSRFQRSTVPGKPSGGVSGPVQGGAPDAPATGAITGPVVRVARGNSVTEVSVGGK